MSAWAVRPPTRRVRHVITWTLAAVLLAGGCVRAGGEYRNWLAKRSAQRWLVAVQVRQLEYYRTARRYAPTLSPLGVTPPPDARTRLFTFRAGRRAVFLAEICTGQQCWLIDPSGTLRIRSRDAGDLFPPGGWRRSHWDRPDAPAWWPVPGTLRPRDGEAGTPWTAGALDRKPREQPGPKFEAHSGSRTSERRPARPGGGFPESGKRTVVVPWMDPRAIGLAPTDPLPPLSATRDSPALWGPIEEVQR